MGLLHAHLGLDRVESGWELTADRTWWGHNALFGGYAQAFVLAAMRAELDHDGPGTAESMPVRSMTMHFLRPFQDGRHRVDAEVIRRGRSMANVTARSEAAEKVMGHAMANFGVERDLSTGNYTTVEMPPVEPWHPDEEPVVSEVGVPTHTLFDFYPRLGGLAYGGQRSTAEAGGWVRPRFDTPIDESLLTMLADLWLPATYQRWDNPLVAVSIDITLHFRAPMPGGIEPGTPLFVRLRTAQSGRGVVDEDGEVWSPDGRLLLQSRQMRYVTEVPSPMG
ncbi:MAG: thioesterase family protein [Acidimicrobiales bacterium]